MNFLCQINPRMCPGGGRGGGNGNGAKNKSNRRQQQPQQEADRGGRVNTKEFYDQIAQGQIPGEAGKDYPVNSVQGLRNRYQGIQAAPPDLVTPDYPGNGNYVKGV